MPQALVLELVGEKPPLYPTKYAHGLFFTLLRLFDPGLASRLHEAKRKPFTLSVLGKPDRTVRLRVTTLDDVLFQGFLRTLLQEAPKGLALGHEAVRLVRVLASRDAHPLAGWLPWEELASSPPMSRMTLHFLTPTVFVTSKEGGRTRYTPLPDPRLVAQSLLERWQAHSPLPYGPKEEAALRAVFALDLEVVGFRHLRYGRFFAGKAFLPGFTGEVTFHLWSDSLEVQRAWGRLIQLAFFSGVGAKTTMGMGLVVGMASREGEPGPGSVP